MLNNAIAKTPPPPNPSVHPSVPAAPEGDGVLEGGDGAVGELKAEEVEPRCPQRRPRQCRRLAGPSNSGAWGVAHAEAQSIETNE